MYDYIAGAKRYSQLASQIHGNTSRGPNFRRFHPIYRDCQGMRHPFRGATEGNTQERGTPVFCAPQGVALKGLDLNDYSSPKMMANFHFFIHPSANATEQ